jgi:hypothetical protein
MSVVRLTPPNTYEIAGTIIQKPKTSNEYLYIVKRFVKPEFYEEIMCGILDSEYYDLLRPEQKAIVDNYYSYPA